MSETVFRQIGNLSLEAVHLFRKVGVEGLIVFQFVLQFLQLLGGSGSHHSSHGRP